MPSFPRTWEIQSRIPCRRTLGDGGGGPGGGGGGDDDKEKGLEIRDQRRSR